METSVLPLPCSTWSILLSLFGLYLLFIVFHRLFLSPLRTVPGPWYAAISSFWLTTHILRLRRCRAINDLLHKYGPIVRIAPNKIIFLDDPSMKAVYGVSSRLSKSSFYKCLTTNANDHAMTTLEHGPHLARKRGYVAHYNPANLAQFQPGFHFYVNEMVELLTSVANNSLRPVDILLLFRHLFIDVNCTHLFAYNAGSLKAWSDRFLHGDSPDDLSRAIADFSKRGLLKDALPTYLWVLIQCIPCHRWKLFCDSDAFLGRFASERLLEVQNSLRYEKRDDEGPNTPLISRLLSHQYSEEEHFLEKDIISECLGHLIAGTDTTSTTLSFLLWELSRRRDIMIRLQAEVDESMPDRSQIPDIQYLQNLPYLTAVIKEGLRVHSAAPSPLERVVPKSTETEINLLGHRMPAGTIIASQAFSSHRHPGVFFSPDLFLPDRWLLEDVSTTNGNGQDTSLTAGSPASTALFEAKNGASARTVSTLHSSTSQLQMAAHMFPFGHGPRVCGGQNLAQMMLRIVLVAIVRSFDIIAPPETNDKSMAMKDSFVAFPAALECKLFFVPRSE